MGQHRRVHLGLLHRVLWNRWPELPGVHGAMLRLHGPAVVLPGCHALLHELLGLLCVGVVVVYSRSHGRTHGAWDSRSELGGVEGWRK